VLQVQRIESTMQHTCSYQGICISSCEIFIGALNSDKKVVILLLRKATNNTDKAFMLGYHHVLAAHLIPKPASAKLMVFHSIPYDHTLS